MKVYNLSKTFSHIIILIILYYIFGKLVFFLLPTDKIVTIAIFIPEGIALAFAIIYGYKIVIGVFIAQLLLSLSQHIAIVPSLEIAVINTLEATIAIYLFDEFNISKKLKSLKDLFKLFSLIVFILQPFSAILSNIALIVYFQTEIDNLSYNIFAWWFGNVMAQILITPFILLVYYKISEIKKLDLIFYSFLYGIYIYLLVIYLKIDNIYLLFIMSISIIIFVTLTKGLIYALFLNIILSIIISYSIHLGIDIFSRSTINDNLFILIHVLVVWILGMTLKDKIIKILEG